MPIRPDRRRVAKASSFADFIAKKFAESLEAADQEDGNQPFIEEEITFMAKETVGRQ